MEVVKPAIGRLQHEVVQFLATAADSIHESWPDPAGIGPDVNSRMTRAEKIATADALRGAQRIAENTVELEDDGQGRSAIEQWRKLFGKRMPRP